MNITVDFNKAIETSGKEIVYTFEKLMVLNQIDEEWKEHLREMDELKTAVYNATLEQKIHYLYINWNRSICLNLCCRELTVTYWVYCSKAK